MCLLKPDCEQKKSGSTFTATSPLSLNSSAQTKKSLICL